MKVSWKNHANISIGWLLSFSLITSSCNFGSGKKNPGVSAGITEAQAYQIPDTIYVPGGLRIGMTEAEIRQLVKDNPGKYYTNPNQLLGLLHTRIDGKDYSVHLQLYKGKLNELSYVLTPTYKKIDNPVLKEHYQNIYDLIAGMNKYREVEQVYKKKTDYDWPLSMGYQASIHMADFVLGKDYSIDNRFSVYLQEAYGSYSIIFYYRGVKEEESTLRKTIYFD